jgi:quinoprotein glucose dehydrogenase
MKRNDIPRFGLLFASLCLLLTPVSTAQQGGPNGEWHAYAGDAGSPRYAALDQINRDNVDQLEVAWTWKSDNFGDAEFRSETTPLMIDGMLYFTAGTRRNVVAIDAGTGENVWMWRMDEQERWERAARRNSGRGVGYWDDGADGRIYTITPGFHLVALDARTGVPESDFGENGVVDLLTYLDADVDDISELIGTIGNSSPPVVARGTVMVGPALRPGGRVDRENTKGDVIAVDARTGRRKWVFHTVPRPGEFGYDTWENDSAEYTGNAGVWGPFSADEELGYAYLNIETPTNDAYGGHRPGANLYGNSIVAVDIATGQRVWHQQMVHHDIWDYDSPPQPILVDITVEGRPIKALVQLTKQAIAYVVNRETGEPVWPWEERTVPQSDVPGEQTSPTQPFPSRPPPFDQHGITPEDLIDFTPALWSQALQAVEQFRLGPIYTPPSLGNADDGTRGTIVVPGFGGGANWEGGAADPETGFVYVGSATSPTAAALSPPAEGTTNAAYNMGGGAPLPRIEGLPLLKPPYGRITAYNMNTGEIAWVIPNGETPEDVLNNPALEGVEIEPTGIASRAGLLVTRTLLFAGEGSGGRPIFRAYDKATGEEIWRTDIPVGPQQSLPMTYMHEGRQYIVFTSGNGGDGVPARLLAWALPESD